MADIEKYTGIHEGFRDLHEINEAIAAVIFTSDRAGLPVYLHLEDEVMDSIGKQLGWPAGEAPDRIRQCVRATCRLGETISFSRFSRALEKWEKGSELDTPPYLAFLGLAAMAAERMSNDQRFTAAAYYPRLAEELGVPSRYEEVGSAYRAVCDPLWAGLERWLRAWEGERGLPSVAASERFPYVSKVLSQVLVRAVDRAMFPRLFASYGMEPQQDLAPEDMVAFLNQWVPNNATAPLRSLWRKEDVRLPIAEAACSELRTWVGMAAGDAETSFLTRLVCAVRRNFGRKLEMNLEVLHPQSGQARVLEIVLTQGRAASLPFEPSGNRSLRLSDSSAFDPGDMLGGRIELRDQDLELRSLRLPRSVVPLRLDEASRLFVECDRAVLGVPHLLLVREQVGNDRNVHPIAEQVRSVLKGCARPGWVEVPSIDGLPAGWTMFTDVELLTPPENLASMNFAVRVLKPLSSSSINFGGGLQVPGAIRRWSTLRPPEITSITESPEGQVVRVTDAGGRELLSRATTENVLVVQLPAGVLGAGEYTVQMDSTAATRTSHVKLVSADDPAPRPQRALAYEPVEGLGALSASAEALGGSTSVRGSSCDGWDSMPAHDLFPIPADVWWFGNAAAPIEPASPSVLRLDVPEPDPTSCAVTGAHYIVDLPVWTGRITSKFMKGTCKTCGIVREYPMRPVYVWSNRGAQGGSSASKAAPARRLDLSKVPSVEAGWADLWDPILDALSYMRSGSVAELERLAVQVEGSGLATDRLARGLEALGHLDVELDPDTLRPAAWSIAPAVIAQISATKAVLTGRRSQRLIRALSQVAEDHDFWVEEVENTQLPASVVLTSSHEIGWTEVAAQLSELGPVPVTAAPEAALRMASRLPVASTLLNSLPRRTLPAHRQVEAWDAKTSKWVAADDAHRPGGYRLSGFGIVYVLRTERDVAEGMASICTVQLLKHLIAQGTDRPLIAYKEDEQALIVRLGADLPGLYGRAAVLCSGLAPVEDTKQRCLVYRDVPPDVSSLIYGALSQ